MIELDYRKPGPSWLALRLWFFLVGWIGFHLYFAILCPMLSLLRYENDGAGTWLFAFSLIGFVAFLTLVLLLIVKTAFLHSFLDQIVLVVIWFFVGLLGVPYVGIKLLAWRHLTTAPVVTVDNGHAQTWDKDSFYKLVGFEQLSGSQIESFVKRFSRNPRSGHTYASNQRYWVCPIKDLAGSESTINLFMVNTDGLAASEKYSSALVSKIESNPRSIAIYDDLAKKVLQNGEEVESKSRVYLGFFDLALRVREYQYWSLGSYLTLTTFWLFCCLALSRRDRGATATSQFLA
jgi:hypothetical protein